MEFRILESEEVYQGRKIVVKRDTVRYPDGTEHDYEVIHHHGSVVMVPVDKEGRIWVIDQYRPAIGSLLLELPAGTVEMKEDPQICAQRELREEIGMTASSLRKIGGLFIAPGYSNEYMHVYLATNLKEDPLPQDAGEYIQVKQYAAEKLYRMVAEDKIRDGKTVAALALARPFILSA